MFRFALDKREEEKKGKNIFVPKRRKMNRGIWRHKSVSDRLKGWNGERADTLVALLKRRMWKGDVSELRLSDFPVSCVCVCVSRSSRAHMYLLCL